MYYNYANWVGGVLHFNLILTCNYYQATFNYYQVLSFEDQLTSVFCGVDVLTLAPVHVHYLVVDVR